MPDTRHPSPRKRHTQLCGAHSPSQECFCADWSPCGAGSCSEDGKAVGSGGSLKSQLLPWASTRNREKSQAVTALLLGGSHNTDGAKEQSHNRELHDAPSPVDPQVQVLTLWAVQVSLLGNRVLQMWSSSVGHAHSGSG